MIGQKSFYNKGQITIFVIIGIVLLIGAVLFLTMKESSLENAADDLAKSVQKVDSSLEPIQQFVEQCIYTSGKSGLEQLGQHGGYIEPFGMYADKALKYDATAPWDSDGVSLSSSEEGFVPYWTYSSLPVDARNMNLQYGFPTIEEITKRHEDYINRNLGTCLLGLKDLEFKGDEITVLTQPKTTIIYTESDVAIKTEFDLQVIQADGTKDIIKSYFSRIKIPFKKYYDKAKIMAVEESYSNYLEQMLFGLIGTYGRIDFESLPPVYDIDTKAMSVTWPQLMVNYKLQELLNTYVPALSVLGTKTSRTIDLSQQSEEDSNFFKLFQLPIFYTSNEELEMSFMFLNWPIYSKVQGSDSTSDMVIPKRVETGYQGTLLESVAPVDYDNIYRFFYDVTFPVVVEITEKDLPGGDDYTFLFALEANLRANKNWNQYISGDWPIEWDPSQYDLSIVGDDGMTTDPETNKSVPRPQMPTKKLFGEENQRVSGNITVSTIDAVSGDALDDVAVAIGVGSFAATTIGRTSLDLYGLASFTGQGPLVYNGYLSLKKEGYLSHLEPITLEKNISKEIGIKKLYKKETKNFTIKVYDMSTGKIRDPLETETIFVGFSRMQKADNLVSFSNTATFPMNTTSILLDMVPGRYVISGSLMDDEGIVIPANCNHLCDGWWDCMMMDDEDEYIPEADEIMKPMMWGGVEFDENQPWSLSKENTYANNTIELTVMKYSPPACFSDLSKTGNVLKYSQTYRSKLLPRIIGANGQVLESNQGDTGEVNQI